MMPAVRATCLAIGLGLIALLAPAQASAVPRLTPVGTFDHPVFITAPAGDPHRVFVLQSGGVVKIVRDGTVLPQPFLDIGADVDTARAGFTSMAFAPNYATSGYVYVLYDAPATPDPGVDVVIDRYTRSAQDPNRVDPASKLQILRLDFANTQDHDANHLQFGPDGLLYITIGEGANDVDKSQDRTAMRGKLLRIEPLPDGSYRIPRDNPYANSGGDPRVFAYGFRNPWRFSFDLAKREIAIADVQDGHWEEVDLLNVDTDGGSNLGWPCWEGTATHNTDGPCTTPPVQTPPIFEYDHVDGRCAIIGGPVVRDPNLTDLVGRFLYGDYCTGELRSIALDKNAPDDRSIGVSAPFFGLSSFGEDGCGHVFVAHQADPANQQGNNPPGGNVWRIDDGTYVPCPDPQKPPETPPPDQTTPPADTSIPPGTGPSTEPVVLAPDKTPPRLSLYRARRQAVARHGHVVIGAKCNERCTISATVTVTNRAGIARRSFQPAALAAQARILVKMKLRLGKSSLKTLRAVARKRHNARVELRVTARDAAGNATRRTVFVTAVP
jgi:glucose/arabinose dehydrogenase